jgi:hypothetical protein
MLGGEAAHVGADLGQQHLGGALVDAGDRVEQLDPTSDANTAEPTSQNHPRTAASTSYASSAPADRATPRSPRPAEPSTPATPRSPPPAQRPAPPAPDSSAAPHARSHPPRTQDSPHPGPILPTPTQTRDPTRATDLNSYYEDLSHLRRAGTRYVRRAGDLGHPCGERVLAAARYQHAASVVPFVVVSVVFANMYVFAPGLSIAKKTMWIAILTVAAGIANLVLALILVPPLGIVGAAIATATTSLAWFAALLAVSQRLYPVPHHWRQLMAALVTVTVYVAAALAMLPTARGPSPRERSQRGWL